MPRQPRVHVILIRSPHHLWMSADHSSFLELTQRLEARGAETFTARYLPTASSFPHHALPRA